MAEGRPECIRYRRFERDDFRDIVPLLHLLRVESSKFADTPLQLLNASANLMGIQNGRLRC